MYSKEILSLDDVKRVVAAAETEAKRNNWNVVIAVVDDGGHLMYLQREKVQLGSIDFIALDDDWLGNDHEMTVMASNESGQLVIVDHCFVEIDAYLFRQQDLGVVRPVTWHLNVGWKRRIGECL